MWVEPHMPRPTPSHCCQDVVWAICYARSMIARDRQMLSCLSGLLAHDAVPS